MKKMVIGLLALSLLLSACIFDGGHKSSSSKLVGKWEQPFFAFRASSIHFENKDGVNTRNPYDSMHDLDSSSCNPNYLKLDTSFNKKGTWQFFENGTYIEKYTYKLPKPVGNGDTASVYDTAEVTREYEVSGDTLWSILSRIGDKTARSVLLFKFGESDDHLSIYEPLTAYFHGNCSIEKGTLEYLFRKK